ncbi:MAG: Gfo/Idh/MocA family protein [Brotaphodocola sp.]
MEQIRMAVIGFGGMGSKYAQIIADGEIEGLKLQGICCRNQEGQAKIRELYPDVTIYQNVDDTFAHADDFDAVLIVTPHTTHVEIGKLAFAHGKHVLCDKPAGISTAEVKEFVGAKRENTAFAMMFNNRVEPAFQKAKELLEAGTLGNITRVIWTCNNWFRSHYYHQSAPWRSSWSTEAGGLLINQTQHFLDIWQWLFGMPDVIDADMDFGKYNDFAVDDGADIRLIYRSESGINDLGKERKYPGLRGSILSSSGEHPGVNRLEIWGSRGCLTVTDGKVLTFDRNLLDIDTFNRENRVIFAQPEHVKETLVDHSPVNQYRIMLQNFSDHIRKGTPLVAVGEDGLNAIMLTNAAYLSGWTGEKVALPFDDERYLRLLKEKAQAEQ